MNDSQQTRGRVFCADEGVIQYYDEQLLVGVRAFKSTRGVLAMRELADWFDKRADTLP